MADDRAEAYKRYLAYKEFVAQKQQAAPAQDTPVEEKSFGQKALETAGKVADYTSGLGRTALAGAVDIGAGIAGKDADLYKAGDWSKAIKGEAPTGNEILQRAGMEQGAALSDVAPALYNETGEGLALQKGGWADPTGRGVAGFALEQAVDPLTYLSLGGTVAAKGAVKSGTQAAGKGLASIGEKVFMQHADRAALESGKTLMPSTVLLQHGVWGTGKSLEKETTNLAKNLDQAARSATKAAEDKGAAINLFDSPTIQKAQQWSVDASPQKNKAAESFLANLEKDYGKLKPKEATTKTIATSDPITGATRIEKVSTEAVGELPLSKANELKTDLYKELAPTYKAEGKVNPRSSHEDELWKGFASDIKTGIEQKAAQVDPSLGEAVVKNNAEQSALRSAQKAFRREGTKSRNYNPVGAVKSGVATVNPVAALGMLGGDLVRGNPFWTGAGQALYQTGTGAANLAGWAPKSARAVDLGVAGLRATKPQQQNNYELLNKKK